MIELIEKEIQRKSRKILSKLKLKAASSEKYSEKYSEKFEKRTGVSSSPAAAKNPSYWSYNNQFDPIYCIKHSKYLAKVIWRKVQASSYAPVPAIRFQIPKPDGGFREIMQFSIVDSALANVMYRKLNAKNSPMFSGYSFAYRPDKTIFEAVINLKRMMQGSKTYILQYDYRKYFDSIDHSYIESLIANGKFVLSRAEREVVGKFLKHKFDDYPSYQVNNWKNRSVGVPQGSSLSLFLSNIAAHELDMELERQNGSFVRFADDVIAVAHSYSDARQIELKFRQHCERTGVSINFDKSPGIQILAGRKSDDARKFFIDTDDGSNLSSIEFVDFLGHRISSDKITLTDKAVKRIKKKISRIINIHLILYSRRNPPSPINEKRFDPSVRDWDLVTCINEIRRYVYGGLQEREIEEFLERDEKLRVLRGLLGFYPLVNDVEKLAELDGWLKNVLLRAIRERNKLGSLSGIESYKLYSVSEAELLDGSWYTSPTPNESVLPSFVRGWRAARKYYKRYGLGEFDNPTYYSAMSGY